MVSDLNIFAQKWSKIAAAEKVFTDFYLIFSLLRYRLNVFLPQRLKVKCSKILEIRNPGGKVMERNGLKFEHLTLVALDFQNYIT